jgi:hypothetical protein
MSMLLSKLAHKDKSKEAEYNKNGSNVHLNSAIPNASSISHPISNSI